MSRQHKKPKNFSTTSKGPISENNPELKNHFKAQLESLPSHNQAHLSNQTDSKTEASFIIHKESNYETHNEDIFSIKDSSSVRTKDTNSSKNSMCVNFNLANPI